MKKFVSGLVVGVLLFVGATVFADSTSLIGQKIQGIYTIEKNGKKVADAVIINGSAYAPVRSVAEASGTTLKVEGKKIIMGDANNSTTSALTTSVPLSSAELKEERDRLLAEIEKNKTSINYYEVNYIALGKELVDKQPRWQDTINEGIKKIEELMAESATLQQKITDIDTQIKSIEGDYQK